MRNFKTPRIRDKKHLKFISTLPCVVSGKGEVQAAHISTGRNSMGMKSGDNRTLPLNWEVHARQHWLGRESFFWEQYGGVDAAISLAERLYENTGDTDKCLELIINFRAKIFI